MPGTTYEMSKAGEKSGDAAAVQIKGSFSSELPEKKNWKRNALDGIWWKLAVVLTIIVLAVFVVFIVRREKKTCSPREIPQVNLTHAATKTKKNIAMPDSKNSDCVEGSIKESYSSFTFQPYSSNEPHRASGLEFRFDALMKRTNLDLTPLDKTTVLSSDIHYYYNIDRCRIGGGVQVNKRPYIRGPIVFAVDQECSKVHYFDEGSSAWRKYKSARNITCSSHGIHFCAQSGARWTFSSSKSSISGMEFQYSTLVQKLKRFAIELKPLNFLNITEPHYFLNVKGCASTDLARRASITTNTRSSLVFATDHECTTVYAFDEVSKRWLRKTGLGSLSCPWVKRSWCQLGSSRDSTATFEYTSFDLQKPKVFGDQYNFTTLHLKLRSLSTDVDLTTLHQMNSTTDAKGAKYYLNADRCLNGGAVNLNVSPQIRGPLFFAVNGDCSKVFYFSSRSVRWVAYRSAFNIRC